MKRHFGFIPRDTDRVVMPPGAFWFTVAIAIFVIGLLVYL